MWSDIFNFGPLFTPSPAPPPPSTQPPDPNSSLVLWVADSYKEKSEGKKSFENVHHAGINDDYEIEVAVNTESFNYERYIQQLQISHYNQQKDNEMFELVQQYQTDQILNNIKADIQLTDYNHKRFKLSFIKINPNVIHRIF